ncbi:MAG: hypothetical protein ACPG7F_00750 [Aggregatilineales bacterium]
MAALTVTAADVLVTGGSQAHVTLGATLTQGLAVYKDISDNNHRKAAGNDAAASAAGVELLVTSGTDGQPGTTVRNGTVAGMGTTEGVAYFLGTAGAIVPYADLTTGDIVVFMGVGGTGGALLLNIYETTATVQ